MSLNNLEITSKWKQVINSDAQIIFLEGVTGSGKSILSIFKFITKVLSTDSNVFFLVGESQSALERNIIRSDMGIEALFGPMVEYKGSGKGGARVELKGTNKAIYLVSYRDKSTFKKILGSTSGGFFVDEINNSHTEFIGELFTRIARDRSFLICTSNGDEEDKMIYTRYLDRCDPMSPFYDDIPLETKNIFNRREDTVPEWEYYFFGFNDNPKYTDEDISQLYNSHPIGSWQYQTKILGIRGAREGLIYRDALSAENIITYEDALNRYYPKMTVGIDVGGTDFTVFTLNGFTPGFKEMVVIDYMKINNANHDQIWDEFKKWYEPYHYKYKHQIHGAFIDSAAKIMRLTFHSRMLKNYGIQCVGAYKYTIKERIDWGITRLHQNKLIFTDRTKDIYSAFNKAQYTTNKEATDPRDFSDHTFKDMIDSVEYGASPFFKKMLSTLVK